MERVILRRDFSRPSLGSVPFAAPKVSSLLTLTFGYGTVNNGNVMSQQIVAPSLNATQTYLYDALNRINSATEGSTWTRAYYYDRYGNRGMQGDVGIPAPAPLCALTATAGGPSTCNSSTTAWTPAYNAVDNRLNTNWALYDAAGNIVYWKDPVAGSPGTAAYNGENKQRFYCAGTIAACGPSNRTAEYVYDGEGNRVQKIMSGETVTYVYDAFGRLAAEYSTESSGMTAGSYFRTTDHLGSTRLVTNGSGGVVSRYLLPLWRRDSRHLGQPRQRHRLRRVGGLYAVVYRQGTG